MNNAMKDYVKKNVFGASDDELLSKWEKLNKERDSYLNHFDQSDFIINTYTPSQQAEIIQKFLNISKRITFYNASNRLTEIIGIERVTNNDVILNCKFVGSKTSFIKKPYLSTMLRDGSKFKPNIAKTVGEKINELNNEIITIEKEIKFRAEQIDTAYEKELNSYTKLEQEAKTGKKLLNNTCAIDAAKNANISLIDKMVTRDEYVELISWICDHIYSIKVYALESGRSGTALGKNYADISGIHFRNPRYDNNGKLISQDSISAELYFNGTGDAPLDILRKVCSDKRGENLFKGPYQRRLCDKNLALYLLSEFNEFGFEAGKRNLCDNIDKENLINKKLNNQL